MKSSTTLGLTCAGLILLAAAPAAAFAAQKAPAQEAAAPSPEWNARNVEHLFNRAGFGARPAEIEWARKLGASVFVDQLIAGFAPDEPFFLDPPVRPDRREIASMGEQEARNAIARYRNEDRDLLFHFAGWWLDSMLDGKQPLRERMVLFWHGYFTSSARDVKSSVAMIRQNELFRRSATGNFGELVRQIVRDPAMLAYLDNDKNRKGNPNENFARELMELFTLGEGNYTEQDIKEAARALTGWTVDGEGRSYFLERAHDRGPKTVLGVTKRMDADNLVDVLLAQPACPRWVARKLLIEFEGRAPSEPRLADYAAFLRAQKYEIAPFLKRLFLDPAFYADDVVSSRIAGPIEYLVGSSRRLGLEPAPQLLWLAAGQLGQRLFDPPNVKGWDGGTAWITTSSLLSRGNMAGMLLGVVSMEDVLREDPLEQTESMDSANDPSMDGGVSMDGDDMDGASPPRDAKSPPAAKRKDADKPKDLGREMGAMKKLLGGAWFPRIHLTARLQRLGAATDAQIVDVLADELLPTPLTSESRAALLEFLAGERAAAHAEDGKLLGANPDVERLLRRLAHLILSLPEAQLG